MPRAKPSQATLLPRNRVLRALAFEAPDVVPVEYHPSPAGMFEHGVALRDLMVQYGHDFGDAAALPLARPDPAAVDADGRYHASIRDAWGTLWECLVFGIAGHPAERPLDDWADWERWTPPTPPSCSGPAFVAAQAWAQQHRQRYFLKTGWISIFEVMHSVRRFDDVLLDLALDSREIHRLADRIMAYRAQEIQYLLAQGCDAIQFADDFGTQTGLMISPATFRRFFKPRYAELLKPVHAAGVQPFFHSCGQVWELLPDLADLGFTAIWPQLPLYDAAALAKRCRDLHLAVALHPDRSHLMTFGTPTQVRAAVRRLATAFRVAEGGSWFYVEIDNGFPFPNVEALLTAVAALRTGSGRQRAAGA